jgi:hypothetical protein
MLLYGALTAFTILLAVGAAVAIAATGWGIWNYVDWTNDYYIVTNQRVVWLEKIVALYDSRRETPLDSIVSTEVNSGLLGRYFDFGDVGVRTYTGSLLFHNARKPYLFADYVDRFRGRAIVVSREAEAVSFEQDLEKALRRRLDPAYVDVPRLPPSSIKKKPKPVQQNSTFKQLLQTFLKVRYQEGGIITYRKHWFILIQKTWAPLLALALWVGGLVLFSQAGLMNFVTGGLAFIALLFILGWLIYHYWDWNNDIYRLTPTQILDIERKPLGQEQKKTANLDSPDFRVEHTRANLLGILLNFGNVIVNVGQTPFTFEGVYNPDQVHQDVSDYREALQRRKQSQEAARERERMVDWLVAFNELSEKLENSENGGDTGSVSG